MIILYDENSKCCGCEACINICPKNAIQIEYDKSGFSFPTINHDMCIECGKCNDVCAFQNNVKTGKNPMATYAAINKHRTVLSQSSSGGVFAALSKIIFNNKGVIYGCAYDNQMNPKHIMITNENELYKIQGSKYVQSSVGYSFQEIKRFLMDGKQVLFSGTPCQVAGLKSYLGKDYKNLLCADIICHGVPSTLFFRDYIKFLNNKYRGKVINVSFRDKLRGWGLLGKVEFIKGEKVRRKIIIPEESYYYKYFLAGDIYRESCYKCKYACSIREGDFTLGDYWGVERFHENISIEEGVSVLLINTPKGLDLLGKLEEDLYLVKSKLEYAKFENNQLSQPTALSEKREKIFELWRDKGSEYIDRKYYRENIISIFKSKISFYIPKHIKRKILRKIRR